VNPSLRSTASETKHKQRLYPKAGKQNIFCSEVFQAVTARPSVKREVSVDLHCR